MAESADVRSVKLAALAKESGWKQDDDEAQVWATMPGGEEPAVLIPQACAAELLKIASG